jgi:prepilin-type N-terminal cleavage/methylation domain-containing protein
MVARHKHKGFSLVELLVVMSIAVILASIATPSLVDMTKNSRINSAASEFQSVVQLARTEAITRNAIVNLYNPNTDGDWSDDIYLCQAASATTVCASNDVNFIKRFTIGDLTDDNIRNGNITIDSNTTGDSFISVNSNGRLNSAQITIAFCDNREDGDYQLLTISVTGRPSIVDLGDGLCLQ